VFNLEGEAELSREKWFFVFFVGFVVPNFEVRDI
jgi:hypothetical protein